MLDLYTCLGLFFVAPLALRMRSTCYRFSCSKSSHDNITVWFRMSRNTSNVLNGSVIIELT